MEPYDRHDLLTASKAKNPEATNATAPDASSNPNVRFPHDASGEHGRAPTTPPRSKEPRSQPLSPATILRLQGLQQPSKRPRSVETQALHAQRRESSGANSATHFRSLGSGMSSQHNRLRSISYTTNTRDVRSQDTEGNSFESTLLNDIPERQRRITVQGNQESDIWAEVQEALKLKPQVQVKLQAAAPFTVGRSAKSDYTSASGRQKAPISANLLSMFEDSRLIPDNEIIDFSPSVGIRPLHPVPLSSNDGATLDWSGGRTDDERQDKRWSMPLHRRVSKDKSPPRRASTAEIVEKQESLYSDKLSRIKSMASSQTLRKVQITKDQLERRYFTLSLMSQVDGLNLVNVVRWLSSQNAATIRALDDCEPLSWLRHLLKNRSHPRRILWHISALIMEEYMKSLGYELQKLHGDTVASRSLGTPSPSADTSSRMQLSRESTNHSPDIVMLKRKRSDDLLSFEPRIQSRSSLGDDSKWSSEYPKRAWRNSNSGLSDSARNSVNDSFQQDVEKETKPFMNEYPDRFQTGTASFPSQKVAAQRRFESFSPSSSHASYVYRGQGRHNMSDDGSSSLPESSAEDSRMSGYAFPNELDPGREKMVSSLAGNNIQRSTHSLQPPITPRPFTNQSLDNSIGIDNKDDDQMTHGGPESRSIKAVSIVMGFRKHSSRPRAATLSSFFKDKTADAKPHSLNAAEAERRKELLAALRIQNSRVKMVLQSSTKLLRERSELCYEMSSLLKQDYKQLSLEKLVSLSHDPAAVAGSTRTLSGWRAVEDIDQRHQDQLQVLNEYIAILPTMGPPTRSFATEKDISRSNLQLLNDVIDKREQALDVVLEAENILKKVKSLRNDLKTDFDAIEKHTSANYPELLRLEASLDRLANRRNSLVTLGENFLSLVLRATAPFMKTFGRPIWDDVHDFLIIPYYRNDFSGEDKWYPVRFPKRSLSHWIRLLIFTFCTPFALIFALRSIRLLLPVRHIISLPYFVPWMLMYSFFCFSLLTLLSLVVASFITVVCESFIVIWWTAWALRLVR